MKYRSDNNRSAFHFVIIPPGSHRSWTFQFNRWGVLGVGLLLVSFIGFTIYCGVTLATTKAQVAQHNRLVEQSTLQQNQLDDLNSNLLGLKEDIESLIEQEAEIQVLMETAKIPYRARLRLAKKKRQEIQRFREKFQKTFDNHSNREDLIEGKITFFSKVVESLDMSMTAMSDSIYEVKNRFAYTPSIWPLFGGILSGYGWRRHPITKRRRFHKGIDIPSWHGAPVKSTAKGIVEYSGWSGSFGFVVVVNHDFGYRTIYAHCSQLLVKKGERVNKGQLIAQVGSTGLSTGPHLHYEIQKWRRAVRPNKYLNLDMFTASARIW